MFLTDTHCHLDFKDFHKDRNKVLARALKEGIHRFLVPGIDLDSCQSAIDLAEANRPVFASVGIHPNSANTWDNRTIGYLEKFTDHPKVVAIGEIGLDYYRDWAPIQIQKQIFNHQLDFAERLKLPVIIHTRNKNVDDRSCFQDAINSISNFHLTGVFHSFSGNLQEAKKVIDLGFFVGITGPVTFKNATELHKIVASLPLENLLIETDSPFLTPHPYRGKRNEPSNVRFVAKKMGEICQKPVEQIAEITTANAERLFQWSN
jgi:TatD DNase family protein